MKLFPAIDVLGQQCVRLYKGEFNQVTVYGDPVEIALKWRDQGADYLHVVDLDGARDGISDNQAVIARLVATVGIPVQLGGGIRTEADIELWLKAGVARVILGTACCEQFERIAGWVERFGADRIVCGIDCRDGMVAVRGWKENAQVSGVELGRRMAGCGIRTAVYTDISRDGALAGVNVDACVAFGRSTGLSVIASGGVTDLDDLRALNCEKVYGAILGKAIYEKKFTVTQAMEVVCQR